MRSRQQTGRHRVDLGFQTFRIEILVGTHKNKREPLKKQKQISRSSQTFLRLSRSKKAEAFMMRPPSLRQILSYEPFRNSRDGDHLNV
jgi:hypothetical protein